MILHTFLPLTFAVCHISSCLPIIHFFLFHLSLCGNKIKVGNECFISCFIRSILNYLNELIQTTKTTSNKNNMLEDGRAVRYVVAEERVTMFNATENVGRSRRFNKMWYTHEDNAASGSRHARAVIRKLPTQQVSLKDNCTVSLRMIFSLGCAHVRNDIM